MTPQLQQAIKLLALSNLEIEAFIGEALEANPLLDVGSGAAPAETIENVNISTNSFDAAQGLTLGETVVVRGTDRVREDLQLP